MPTYVYNCSACEKTFEIEQRITEDALTDCQCGSKGTVKRIIQPIAVMFKGGGFHINDYAPAAVAEPATAAPAEAAPASLASESPACSGAPAACPACTPKAP